jgi:hypothetical protein
VVERAREVQRKRFANTSLRCNADMGPTEVGVAGNARGVPAGRDRPGAGESGDAGWCLKTGTSLATDERSGAPPHPQAGAPSRIWPGASGSRRRTWRKRSSTGHGGRSDQRL